MVTPLMRIFEHLSPIGDEEQSLVSRWRDLFRRHGLNELGQEAGNRMPMKYGVFA